MKHCRPSAWMSLPNQAVLLLLAVLMLAAVLPCDAARIPFPTVTPPAQFPAYVPESVAPVPSEQNLQPLPPATMPALNGRVSVAGQRMEQIKTKVRLGATHWGQRLQPTPTVGHYPPTAAPPVWVAEVAVLPVYKLGGQRAFRDVGELVTQALATQLGQTLRQTQVVGPVQWSSSPAASTIEDALAALETDWRRYGQPSPVTARALDMAVTPVFTAGAIGATAALRLLLVDVELDLTTPYTPSDLKSRVKFYLQDSLPQTASYRLKARIWGMDPGPSLPLMFGEVDVWVPVNGDNVTGMTASVNTLEGTAQVFRQAANSLAHQAVNKLPANWLLDPAALPSQSSATTPPPLEPAALKY